MKESNNSFKFWSGPGRACAWLKISVLTADLQAFGLSGAHRNCVVQTEVKSCPLASAACHDRTVSGFGKRTGALHAQCGLNLFQQDAAAIVSDQRVDVVDRTQWVNPAHDRLLSQSSFRVCYWRASWALDRPSSKPKGNEHCPSVITLPRKRVKVFSSASNWKSEQIIYLSYMNKLFNVHSIWMNMAMLPYSPTCSAGAAVCGENLAVTVHFGMNFSFLALSPDTVGHWNQMMKRVLDTRKDTVLAGAIL